MSNIYISYLNQYLKSIDTVIYLIDKYNYTLDNLMHNKYLSHFIIIFSFFKEEHH